MRRAVAWMCKARGGGNRKRFPPTPDLVPEVRHAVGAVILITLIEVDVRRTRTLRGLVKASSSGGEAWAPHS